MATHSFPQFSAAMVDFCNRSANEFVRFAPQLLDGFFELNRALPDKYGWRLSDVVAFEQQLANVTNSREVNRLYWEDQSRNIEVYSAVTVWRGAELVKASIRSLNVGEVVTPAVLGRALLELAATYLTNSNTIEANLSQLQFPSNARVAIEGFEEQVLKMIWGTRLGDPAPYLKQTNVLTLLQKLSRNPKAVELWPTYEFLCEVAHPNVVGNSRYWSHVERVNPDGSKTVSMSRDSRGDHAAEILEATIWAVGWSAECLRNGFTLIRNGLGELLEKLRNA